VPEEHVLSVNDLDFGVGASGKLKGALALLLAIFLSGLAVGIVGSPMRMHPVLAILLKAFILLVFGGIAAFGVASALRSFAPSPSLPPEARARCLTCGEATPNDAVCPVCAEPPGERAHSFQVRSESLLGVTFVTAIFAGVGCLGAFILIGPYLDGERRAWALIAFAALGLLLLSIGAVGVFGFVSTLRDHLRGARDISFSCTGPDRRTQGNGKLAWRSLVWLEGHGQVTGPLLLRGQREGGYRASPGDVALAEMVATFDAAGLVDLGDVTTYEWRVGDPSRATRVEPVEFRRTIERRVTMVLRRGPFFVTDPEDDEVDATRHVPDQSPATMERDVGRFLSRYLQPALGAREFKAKLDADPAHRAQAEVHARVLRDRGLVPAKELVDAVMEGLVRG
jgi:hypothetical protein